MMMVRRSVCKYEYLEKSDLCSLCLVTTTKNTYFFKKMISGRNRILFTKLKAINPLKCNYLNQTWSKDSIVLENKLLTKNRLASSLDEILTYDTKSDEIVIESDAHAQKCLEKLGIQPPNKNISTKVDRIFLKAIESEDDELLPSDVVTILSRFNSFWALKKNKIKMNCKSREIIFSIHFQKLCNIVKYSLKEIDSDDLLLLIFFCKNFKVPDDYINIAEIIQEVHRRKEKLNLNQLVMLYHILLNNLENEFATNLKKECESVLLILAKRKMKSEIVEDKLDVLAHATMFPLPNKFKIDVLYTMLDLGEETWCRYNLTKNFLNLLHSINSNDPDFPILEKKLMQVLMDYSNNGHFAADIPHFIPLISRMVLFEKIEYKRELFDGFVNAALKHNLSYDDKLNIIFQGLLQLKHIHYGLLINIIEEINGKPELMNENVFLTLGRSLTFLNFKCKNNQLEILFNWVDNVEVNNSEASLTKYLLMLIYSITLGHFPEKLVKSVSDIINVEGFSLKRNENLELMLYIHNAVAVWHPDFSDQFLSQEKFLLALEKWKCNAVKGPDKPLGSFKIKKWIESDVGIENCVLTDLCTKNGLWIDQVMVLNKKGEPIRLSSKNNKEINYVDDIFVPHDHKIVFILNFNHYVYCRNVYGLRSKHWLKMKLLEELGGIVITSSFAHERNDFKSDSESGRYLWTQIKGRFVTKMEKLPTDEIEEPITIPYYPFLEKYHINDIDVVIPSEKQWMDGFLSTLEGQIWYTDGSKYPNGAAGSGVYYPEGDLELSLNLETDSSFEAEVNGMLECAKEAYAFLEKSKEKNTKPVINILTDNQHVIKMLIENHFISSKSIGECINAVQRLSEIANIRLIWVPGHFGITGNMVADTLAKKGATVCDSE